MIRPVILVLLGHYLPGFKAGGPLRSIANLVDRLGGEFDIRILCADRDLGDSVPYPGVVPDRWTAVGQAQVRYIAPAGQGLRALARIIRDTPHDALYLNSFFSPRFTILPLTARRLGLIPARPLVIAPRGEFSPGALALKGAKKRGYIAFGKAAGLFADALWQASSEAEANDIRSALGESARDIRVAMDLPASLPAEPPPHLPRQPGAPLRVVFVGRISPMKNLDYALRILASVESPLVFSIAGPPEDAAYLAECKALAAKLPDRIRVDWLGSIDPAAVPALIAAHDLFFLPTRGENFGHVIAEALSAGTPVLISNATPWRGLSKAGIGADLPLSGPQGFVEAIDGAAAQSPEAAAAQRACVFAHAREWQAASDDVEANRWLFRAALHKGKSRRHS